MAYFKGQGGRPKGSKNKATDLHAKCAKVKIDVFERLLELAVEANGTKGEWYALMDLVPYLYAKPRDNGEAELTAEQIREWIREQNDKSSSGS